jgi:hypothetical protein
LLKADDDAQTETLLNQALSLPLFWNDFLIGPKALEPINMEEIVEALAHHPILSMWTKEMPK